MSRNMALFNAILAYSLWGLAPIYWKQLQHIDSLQIVMHRMFWSFILIMILVTMLRQWAELRPLLRDRRLLKVLFFASALMSINWAVYIWAVNAGNIVETSMGYFINPLLTVLLAVIFFNERLRPMQMLALLTVLAGVGYLVFMQGYVPWIALTLATTFALYSAVKKSVNVPATLSMTIEMGYFVIPALGFLLYSESQQAGSTGLGSSIHDNLLLIGGGLVTLAPLTLFASAAKNISLTALGMSQYIGPTLQLASAIYLYNEPFDQTRLIAFSLIWVALIIYSLDQLNHRRRRVVRVV